LQTNNFDWLSPRICLDQLRAYAHICTRSLYRLEHGNAIMPSRKCERTSKSSKNAAYAKSLIKLATKQKPRKPAAHRD